MSVEQIRVWDLPVRLFHWGLVLGLIGAYGTGELGWLDMSWHFRFGYLVLGLVVFRVLWGLVGPRYARFSQFVRGPGAIWRYLRGASPAAPGHNPLGGWAVLLLLLAVLAQALSGLFNGDDIEWFGPLYDRVSGATQSLAHRWHDIGYRLLLVLGAIHVAAVLGYWLIKGRNLIAPMLHGRQPGEVADASPPGSMLALLASALISAGLVAAVVYLGPG
ncbi:MAG: cytochrome b/b6 domain-containing protein [Xanthomonadales bacterium]|nr:cytochrome b/b6 domain-containing protein [Xanthomonadales bacterium]